MKAARIFILLFLSMPLLAATAFSQSQTAAPVSSNASPEAKALLQLLYDLSGKYTLTGQHNYPRAVDTFSVSAAQYIGRTPVIWSMDMGFAKGSDKDSYLMRPINVKEAIKQNKAGAIVTICWHAVPPTADEPITFQPLPGADPQQLKSVQGRLTDQQFKDILTPGTELNKRWAKQVDSIARYLKQLQKAHVPVLLRLYHEMNGNWFWWGNYAGQNGTAALYRQAFDRLVNYHKLNNLVWVWSVDRPTHTGMEFTSYYPGDQYVDVLALDVYGSDFKQDYYDQLLTLAKGKPITLAEVGNPPKPEILAQQPKWSYWVVWAGMANNTTKAEYNALIDDPHVLWQESKAYKEAMNPYRKVLKLPLLKEDN